MPRADCGQTDRYLLIFALLFFDASLCVCAAARVAWPANAAAAYYAVAVEKIWAVQGHAYQNLLWYGRVMSQGAANDLACIFLAIVEVCGCMPSFSLSRWSHLGVLRPII